MAAPSPSAVSSADAPPLAPDVVRAIRDDGALDGAAFADDAVGVLVYRRMVVARHVDERLVQLQREGRVAYHTSAIGEEGAVVASASALRDGDWIFPTSHDAAAALARGVPLVSYAHHVFGTGADEGKGRQMPERVSSSASRVVSASALLGTHLPHAVGVAWAAKGQGIVALAYVTEAAAYVGDFHNALNFAGVFRAPVVFFARSWRERPHAAGPIADKGVAYGVPAVRVDGSDPFAVLRVTRDAVARAADGQGPTLVEAIVSASPARDPIARARRALEVRRAWDDAKESALVAEVERDVAAALETAERADPPAASTLFDDVYAALPWHLREQRARHLAQSSKE